MEDKILKQFAKRLKKLREDRALSQEELALKSNLDRTYIGRIERAERNPSLKSLYKIAVALDLSLPELVDLDSLND
ncbi:MAG: hypothetical protein A2255_02395 [Candidatus Melainabacteria bacterium RIFOXYA2_FULL_32_9]|nr:MAG: hypothetical protein A2255_02395 [Candidatus Melainabacteria bacterium RIFOXYA2_FULL_32_9]